MGEANRARVEMCFADGSAFSSWMSFNLRDTYTDPVGSLDFEAAPLRDKLAEHRERFGKGQLVTLKVGGVSQGGFLVQTVQQSIGRDGVVFKLSCASPLVTALQATVNPDVSFHAQTDVPIASFVLDLLTPILGPELTIFEDPGANVDAISGKPRDGRKARPDIDALKHQDAQTQAGESHYDCVKRVVTRLGYLVRMAADGALIIDAPDFEQRPGASLHQTFNNRTVADSDRMLDGIEIVDTNDNQFSECVVFGMQTRKKDTKQTSRPSARAIGATALAARPTATPTNGMTATTVGNVDLREGIFTYASAPETAPYKPLIIVDKNSRDHARCASVAKLAMGKRAKDAFSVTCEVDGFMSRTGRLWQVDTVARVVIEAAGIDEPMWVLERVFQLSRERGQTTKLKLIPLHSLVLGDPPT